MATIKGFAIGSELIKALELEGKNVNSAILNIRPDNKITVDINMSLTLEQLKKVGIVFIESSALYTECNAKNNTEKE